MLRIPALQLALSGLVGLRPHYTGSLPPYTPDLLECRSGLYLNGLHPLITPEHLVAALPKTAIADFPAFDSSTFYQRGSMVQDGGKLYQTLKGGIGAISHFTETTQVSGRLRQTLDDAAAQVLTALLQRKKAEGAKGVLEERQLYHGAGSLQNRIIKEGRFCGMEIVPKPGRDIVVRLSRIGLQVDTPNPELAIYLYHSSQAEPIRVIEPKLTGSGIFAWAAVEDVYLTLNDAAYGPGGSFFLGYYEEDLVGQIVDRQKSWTDAISAGVGCGTCDPETTQDFQLWSQHLEFHPFYAPAAILAPERTLFDAERLRYNYGTNWGLNLTVALECDLTQFLTRHEGILADAICKQAAINVLSIFANTTENNALAEQCRQAALYQLDNRENYTPGLKKELEKALEALSLDVVDTDSPCLPKKASRNRISHGAI